MLFNRRDILKIQNVINPTFLHVFPFSRFILEGVCTILFTHLILVTVSSKSSAIFINEFAVHVNGSSNDAQHLAEKHGFIFRGQIGNLHNYYLFEKDNIKKRSVEPNIEHYSSLQSESLILWVEQQHIKRRVKREALERNDFSDPLYPDQWFLHGGGRGGYDMNVIPAWKDGYTGKGVVVTILDDGIQTNHPDLAENYDKLASLDINDKDDDPTPQDNNDNKHGTRCAGEVAAVAFNEFCGVGIAYNASIGGIRMLDGSVTDATEAIALSHNPNHVHIYSSSWGPDDDGKTVDGPGSLAKLAFTNGISKGRSGLGSIFVWASGNGGRNGDSCNCDGYTNSIYTLSISSATQGGTMPWYLEQCSSTLATTYSSGTVDRDKSIASTDVDYTYFADIENNRKPNPSNLCTKSHTGTSASAPIAAAICALALEANPKLTWRDMQYLVVMTSRPDPLLREPGWVENGVKRLVSSKFGYGLMDAGAMVKLAKQWVTVPPQLLCETKSDSTQRVIPANRGGTLIVSMMVDSCKNSEQMISYLEHVQVKITLLFKPRGNLKIVLISPAGTRSDVLFPRIRDIHEGSFNDWPFMSVHFWGEDCEGMWKLNITNDGEKEYNQAGKLIEWSLAFYGTKNNPIAKHLRKDKYQSPSNIVTKSTEYYGSFHKLKACIKQKKLKLKTDRSFNCVETCPNGMYADMKEYTCHPCDKSCYSCYGPSQNNCLMCQNGLFLHNDTCNQFCANGFYEDSLLSQCLPCTPSCLTCQTSHDFCLTCKSTFLLYQNHCVQECPEGTYFHDSTNTCKFCHFSCLSCNNEYEDNCLRCKSGLYLYHHTCMASCPHGFYPNDLGYCSQCHRSCSSCSNATYCTKCNTNWIRSYDSGLCSWSSDCPKGWHNPASDSCESCSKYCTLCNGSKKNCVYCENGYLLDTNMCVKSCPEGSFVNIDECSNCTFFGTMCLKCNKDHCLDCKEGFILHNGICVSSCPVGFYFSNESCIKCDSCSEGMKKDYCISCKLNKNEPNQKYSEPCFDGHARHPKSMECFPCYHRCKSCNGLSPFNCTSCCEDSTLRDGICIPCTENEYYNETLKKCERCDDRCRRCSGHTEFNCLSCKMPLRFEKSLHTCLPCCNSKLSYDKKCCTCSQNLDICANSFDYTRSIAGSSFSSSDSTEIEIALNSVSFIISSICISTVLLFVVLFGILHIISKGCCHFQKFQYKRVPSKLTAKFDSTLETVSLTQNELDEDDDIYEKT